MSDFTGASKIEDWQLALVRALIVTETKKRNQGKEGATDTDK